VKDKPLVIPEINGDGLVSEPLIANPNCTTAVGAMALWPIHQKYKLKKVPDLHFFWTGRITTIQKFNWLSFVDSENL